MGRRPKADRGRPKPRLDYDEGTARVLEVLRRAGGPVGRGIIERETGYAPCQVRAFCRDLEGEGRVVRRGRYRGMTYEAVVDDGRVAFTEERWGGLREAREARGWTSYELAERLGWSQTKVSQWERGVPGTVLEEDLRQLREILRVGGAAVEPAGTDADAVRAGMERARREHLAGEIRARVRLPRGLLEVVLEEGMEDLTLAEVWGRTTA